MYQESLFALQTSDWFQFWSKLEAHLNLQGLPLGSPKKIVCI